ncbi:MAG TPA: mechanosensitive ion channel family protein [Gemmatimonadales bacterium]|nr:mechanosensitive ion channel family protein [Gemmatimonadales bacterium]
MPLALLLQAEAADSADQGVVGTVGRWLDLTPGYFAELALRVVFVWFLVWVAIRLVRMVARRIVAAVDDGDDASLSSREKRGQTAAQLVRSVGGVTAVIFGIIATLNLFIDIRPILAGAGILGLAISFGAQSLVKDIISGFFILVEDQFVVGDVIEAAGRTGTVERVTLRVVTLRDLRGVVHMIPNGQLTAVSNLTRSWSRAVVDIGVAYEANVDRALEVFREEASTLWEDPAWKPKLLGAPDVVGVDELGDSGVILRTMVRTQPGNQWECAREFRRRIKNRLDQEGIEIPFPQRTVHIRQAKDVDEKESAAS